MYLIATTVTVVSRGCCWFCASPLRRRPQQKWSSFQFQRAQHSVSSLFGLETTTGRPVPAVCATVSSCHFCKEIRYSDQTNPLLSNK